MSISRADTVEGVLYGEHSRSLPCTDPELSEIKFPPLSCHYDPGRQMLISDRDDALIGIPVDDAELRLLLALQERWPYFVKDADLARQLYGNEDTTLLEEQCNQLRKRLQIISRRASLIICGDSYRLARS